jgi:hypothetical protein
MSHEIRHFLVFVEQDSSVGRPLLDENIPLPFSIALKEHFGARVEEGPSPVATTDHGQTPFGGGVAPGPR